MQSDCLLSLNDIQKWLLNKSSQILMLSHDDIDCDAHLTEIGMDSQEVFSLIGDMEGDLGCAISPSIIEDTGSINGVAEYVHKILSGK